MVSNLPTHRERRRSFSLGAAATDVLCAGAMINKDPVMRAQLCDTQGVNRKCTVRVSLVVRFRYEESKAKGLTAKGHLSPLRRHSHTYYVNKSYLAYLQSINIARYARYARFFTGNTGNTVTIAYMLIDCVSVDRRYDIPRKIYSYLVMYVSVRVQILTVHGTRFKNNPMSYSGPPP
jgi:hypothetical protein